MTTPSSRQKKQQRRPNNRPPARPAAQRQPAVRRVVEPPDYSKDYADVRRDLIRIAVLMVILFAGMIGVSFFV